MYPRSSLMHLIIIIHYLSHLSPQLAIPSHLNKIVLHCFGLLRLHHSQVAHWKMKRIIILFCFTRRRCTNLNFLCGIMTTYTRENPLTELQVSFHIQCFSYNIFDSSGVEVCVWCADLHWHRFSLIMDSSALESFSVQALVHSNKNCIIQYNCITT